MPDPVDIHCLRPYLDLVQKQPSITNRKISTLSSGKLLNYFPSLKMSGVFCSGYVVVCNIKVAYWTLWQCLHVGF